MKAKYYLVILSFVYSVNLFAVPPEEDGKKIFIARCAACHSVNKDLTGPALAGISERRSADWIIRFIQSSQTLVQGGDQDAVALFEKYNRIPMPDHKDLSDQDINNIISFINASTVVTPETDVPFRKPATPVAPAYLPLTIQDYGFFGALLIGTALLIAALLMLVRVKKFERERG